MTTLTYELLHKATAGGAVALRSRMALQPAGGKGDKIFPPTYAVDSRADHKYAIEERQTEQGVIITVLLDSVASQANRAELALLEGWGMKELSFPVAYVDFTADDDLADLGKLTVLEAPHRIADAIFRDSLLDDTLFRLSEVGRAITDAHPRNATALFRYSPTSLLWGVWDSTGPKGGLGSKFQRSYVSEIVGLNAKIGRKVGSRLDPLQIERAAAYHIVHPLLRVAGPELERRADRIPHRETKEGADRAVPDAFFSRDGSSGRCPRALLHVAFLVARFEGVLRSGRSNASYRFVRTFAELNEQPRGDRTRAAQAAFAMDKHVESESQAVPDGRSRMDPGFFEVRSGWLPVRDGQVPPLHVAVRNRP